MDVFNADGKWNQDRCAFSMIVVDFNRFLHDKPSVISKRTDTTNIVIKNTVFSNNIFDFSSTYVMLTDFDVKFY